MKIIESSISIAAPIERVWSILVDIGGYPEWNPFVIRASADGDPTAVGTTMRFLVRWSTGGTARSLERIEACEPPANGAARWSYAYRGPLASLGLVRGTRTQTLERTGDGTLYRSVEPFSGALLAFVPLDAVRDGFERQARALRARAERR
ncbi:MAG: SRPBCC domain-containing protein [Polyangiaceae bacterium]